MEKEFVPYKIALELKDLGFDESCFGFYSQNNSLIYYQDSPNDYNYLEEAIQNIISIGSNFTDYEECLEQCLLKALKHYTI